MSAVYSQVAYTTTREEDSKNGGSVVHEYIKTLEREPVVGEINKYEAISRHFVSNITLHYSLSPDGSASPTKSSVTPKHTVSPWGQKFSTWIGVADFLFSFGGLVYLIVLYAAFLKWHETRTDIEWFAPLSDPVLTYFQASDLSLPLFVTAYGSMVLSLIYSRKRPDLMVEMAQTHFMVILVRMLALFVTPLEVPKGTIPLVDPIANPKDGVLMRDLFFSGHTATTFVAFLVCRRQHMRWKLLLGFIAFVTAIMVLIQKTHYSIDVLSAPFFVHGSHTMTKELRRLCGLLYQVDEEKTQAKVEQKEKTI